MKLTKLQQNIFVIISLLALVVFSITVSWIGAICLLALFICNNVSIYFQIQSVVVETIMTLIRKADNEELFRRVSDYVIDETEKEDSRNGNS